MLEPIKWQNLVFLFMLKKKFSFSFYKIKKSNKIDFLACFTRLNFV